MKSGNRIWNPSVSLFFSIGVVLVLLGGILWGLEPVVDSLGELLCEDYGKSLERHFLCWETYVLDENNGGRRFGFAHFLPYFCDYFYWGTKEVEGEQTKTGTMEAGIAAGTGDMREKPVGENRPETILEGFLQEQEREKNQETKEDDKPLEGPGGSDCEGASDLQPPPREEVQEPCSGGYFLPHDRQCVIGIEELSDYETLLKKYYTVDPSTMVGTGQLNGAAFMEKDFRIEKDSDGPQILIYHTHSREGYLGNAEGETGGTVVDVGDYLTRILEDDYGYQVLHHTEAYDRETRNNAYSRALPGIEALLKEYPTIQVVIDLHRDEMPEGTKLLQEIDGKPTARFMFFNGLSRTKTTGDLDYLHNPYQEENLAFSFQMEVKAMEYYPGLTRKNYLKGYRYNMHVCPRTLLIELGAQNNTYEEALRACGPLAHVLDLVLSGENR